MKLAISPSISYRKFGYIPSGSLKADLSGWLLGAPNLLKRLQARDVMSALEIRASDCVLDFGCGSGYFTVEMAKLCRRAYGVDVTPYLHSVRIPEILGGRLEYLVAEGRQLPFPQEHFDRILASEVLPMAENPEEFLVEIRRVIKPGGRLVVVNGAGHPSICEAYREKHWLLEFLRRLFPKRFPKSYEEYCSRLQGSFGTSQKVFFDHVKIEHLLTSCGFQVVDFRYSPGYLAGTYLSWSQFIRYVVTGRSLSQAGFAIQYLLLHLVQRYEKRRHQGGLLCVATR